MKIIFVFGTRPEAIKMAPVIREFQTRMIKGLTVKVCVTAQHREMLDQVLNLFQIKPDYDLNLMEDNQSPCRVASGVLNRLEPILKQERPDWLLVQGDTTTVAAASLAAFYSKIKVGHVEAGLRTHDKWLPFPEEINRRLAGVIADLHFAPTKKARENLLKEGINEDKILVTGNTVIDALHWAAALPCPPEIEGLLKSKEEIRNPNSENRGESGRTIRNILVTVHRRENFGKPLEDICLALRQIGSKYDGRVKIFYPVHLNPSVWKPVHQLLKGNPQIKLFPPLEYLPFVQLMKRSYLVLTDSGGIQEEAPALGVPVLVTREKTERPEAVEAGTVRLVGTKPEKILEEVSLLLDDPGEYNKMARSVNPYGDGKASQRIVSALLEQPWEPFDPI